MDDGTLVFVMLALAVALWMLMPDDTDRGAW